MAAPRPTWGYGSIKAPDVGGDLSKLGQTLINRAETVRKNALLEEELANKRADRLAATPGTPEYMARQKAILDAKKLDPVYNAKLAEIDKKLASDKAMDMFEREQARGVYKAPGSIGISKDQAKNMQLDLGKGTAEDYDTWKYGNNGEKEYFKYLDPARAETTMQKQSDFGVDAIKNAPLENAVQQAERNKIALIDAGLSVPREVNQKITELKKLQRVAEANKLKDIEERIAKAESDKSAATLAGLKLQTTRDKEQYKSNGKSGSNLTDAQEKQLVANVNEIFKEVSGLKKSEKDKFKQNVINKIKNSANPLATAEAIKPNVFVNKPGWFTSIFKEGTATVSNKNVDKVLEAIGVSPDTAQNSRSTVNDIGASELAYRNSEINRLNKLLDKLDKDKELIRMTPEERQQLKADQAVSKAYSKYFAPGSVESDENTTKESTKTEENKVITEESTEEEKPITAEDMFDKDELEMRKELEEDNEDSSEFDEDSEESLTSNVPPEYNIKQNINNAKSDEEEDRYVRSIYEKMLYMTDKELKQFYANSTPENKKLIERISSGDTGGIITNASNRFEIYGDMAENLTDRAKVLGTNVMDGVVNWWNNDDLVPKVQKTDTSKLESKIDKDWERMSRVKSLEERLRRVTGLEGQRKKENVKGAKEDLQKFKKNLDDSGILNIKNTYNRKYKQLDPGSPVQGAITYEDFYNDLMQKIEAQALREAEREYILKNTKKDPAWIFSNLPNNPNISEETKDKFRAIQGYLRNNR